MPGIFFCYRRKDTAYQAGHIYDQMVQHFGEQVYKDVDSIALGDDFVRAIEQLIDRTDIVLVLIGDGWLESDWGTGRLRLEELNDFVRREIELALRGQEGIVPILPGQSQMPEVGQLPDSVRPLASGSGIRVHPAPHFHWDMERLVQALEKHVQPIRFVPDKAADRFLASGQVLAHVGSGANQFPRVLAGVLAQDYPREQGEAT
jgi:TIR domain